jgi:hypothetical protein
MVEKGCHEALLAQRGHYHRLYELQFKAQEERVVRTSLGTEPLGRDG